LTLNKFVYSYLKVIYWAGWSLREKLTCQGTLSLRLCTPLDSRGQGSWDRQISFAKSLAGRLAGQAGTPNPWRLQQGSEVSLSTNFIRSSFLGIPSGSEILRPCLQLHRLKELLRNAGVEGIWSRTFRV